MVRIIAAECLGDNVELHFSDGTSALLSSDLLADIVRAYLHGLSIDVLPRQVLN